MGSSGRMRANVGGNDKYWSNVGQGGASGRTSVLYGLAQSKPMQDVPSWPTKVQKGLGRPKLDPCCLCQLKVDKTYEFAKLSLGTWEVGSLEPEGYLDPSGALRPKVGRTRQPRT